MSVQNNYYKVITEKLELLKTHLWHYHPEPRRASTPPQHRLDSNPGPSLLLLLPVRRPLSLAGGVAGPRRAQPGIGVPA